MLFRSSFNRSRVQGVSRVGSLGTLDLSNDLSVRPEIQKQIREVNWPEDSKFRRCVFREPPAHVESVVRSECGWF